MPIRELLEQVPGLTLAQAQDETTRVATLGPFQRTALWAYIGDIAPHLNAHTIRHAETIGDLLNMVGPRGPEQEITGRERGSNQTRRVRLAALDPTDAAQMSALYVAATNPTSAPAWRFRGRTPSPQEFQASLFDPGVHIQYVAQHPLTGEVFGLLVGYDYDPAAGHIKLGFLSCNTGGPGMLMEAMVMFIDHLFMTFPLRKVYFELPEYNLGLVAGIPTDLLREESRLVDYIAKGEALYDLITYALPRAPFESLMQTLAGPA